MHRSCTSTCHVWPNLVYLLDLLGPRSFWHDYRTQKGEAINTSGHGPNAYFRSLKHNCALLHVSDLSWFIFFRFPCEIRVFAWAPIFTRVTHATRDIDTRVTRFRVYTVLAFETRTYRVDTIVTKKSSRWLFLDASRATRPIRVIESVHDRSVFRVAGNTASMLFGSRKKRRRVT